MPKAYPESVVQQWEADMNLPVPGISSRHLERWSTVRGIDYVRSPEGLLLRMMSHGGDMADVYINPVLARHLMRVIAQAGQQSGWLDERLNVRVPDLPAGEDGDQIG